MKNITKQGIKNLYDEALENGHQALASQYKKQLDKLENKTIPEKRHEKIVSNFQSGKIQSVAYLGRSFQSLNEYLNNYEKAV